MDEMSYLVCPPDRIELVTRLRALSARLGRRPYLAEFCQDSGLSVTQVRNCFGAYHRLLRIGGFPSERRRRFDDDTLLRALRDGLMRAGGLVRAGAFQPAGGPAAATIAKRWRGWTGALAALRDWLEKDEPDYPHLEALRRYCAGASDPHRLLPARCGDLLRFRALDHAPVSELGVVFLFGQVAEELGFVLETVRKDFPDALGRRRIGGQWHRVRIEFEQRSSHFERHAHDPRACDLIVCWEHDWLQCPLEVLELKAVIARLKRGAVLARLP